MGRSMKTIQIRNVPDELHSALQERAAREGLSLPALIRAELPRLAGRPSPERLVARIQQRASISGRPAAVLIREERAER